MKSHFHRYATACRQQQLRTLVDSMHRHCGAFSLDVLCWDFEAPKWSDKEPGIHYTSRADFLRRHPDLVRLPGPPRSTNETVCSVRWSFVLDVMQAKKDPVTLIDGDLWFWSSPELVFEEIGNASLAVSPHGFAPASEGLPGVTLESHGKYGRFNGGWSTWRDPRAARRMAELARDWCYIGFKTLPDGRRIFGDQGHLETVADEFGGHVIRHPGVNLGPWNIHRYPLKNYSGDQRLIAFHYSSLRPGIQLADAPYAITAEQERLIYAPYLAALGS